MKHRSIINFICQKLHGCELVEWWLRPCDTQHCRTAITVAAAVDADGEDERWHHVTSRHKSRGQLSTDIWHAVFQQSSCTVLDCVSAPPSTLIPVIKQS